MNKKEFDNWVKKMLEWKPKHYTCWQILNSRIVVCVNAKNGKTGVARCHSDDEYNYSYGKAIAIARCAGKEVPTLNEYKAIWQLQNGDIFMYQGRKYRYIGKVSAHNYAVIDILTDKLTTTYYHYDYVEVEICS